MCSELGRRDESLQIQPSLKHRGSAGVRKRPLGLYLAAPRAFRYYSLSLSRRGVLSRLLRNLLKLDRTNNRRDFRQVSRIRQFRSVAANKLHQTPRLNEFSRCLKTSPLRPDPLRRLVGEFSSQNSSALFARQGNPTNRHMHNHH